VKEPRKFVFAAMIALLPARSGRGPENNTANRIVRH
jgi:hypothetical protein